MLKVLSGTNYDLARLVGIKREIWVRVTGIETPITDTQYAMGNIVTNSQTGDTGMLVDSDNMYFSYIPDIHINRLVDVVKGDGWNDIVIEQE